MIENIVVSVIVPVLNEEKFIGNFIKSLIRQTYPREKMEWILIDGNSNDKTLEIIEKYKLNNELPIKLLNNKKKKTPFALNMGIERAKGKYIIRLDAHAEFSPDYIEKCVFYLENIDADNVGGVVETSANTFVGKAISHMLSTKFGVGGSDFRIGTGNKYVDTVPFGAFKKEVFDRVGLFNTELLRSEDNDMNARIRNSGGKIWLANDIRFKYYCRDTIRGILRMGLQNGNALFFTFRKNLKAMSLRHFVPFFFLISIFLFPLVGIKFSFVKGVFMIETFLYITLDVCFSFFNRHPLYGIINIFLYPLFHLTYGFGSLLGLFNIKVY